MKVQAKAQDTLPIEDVDRHPMWARPASPDEGTYHVFLLRYEMARALTPFDGRPNSEFVIEFCKQVHAASTLETGHKDPFWLIGQVMVLGYGMRAKLDNWAHHVAQPATKPLYRAEAKVIERLQEEFAHAVARSLI